MHNLFKMIGIGLPFFCWTGCAIFSNATPPPSTPIPIRQAFPAFRLLDYQGKAVGLSAFYLKNNPIIIFCRNLKRDGEWLRSLKPKLKELYVEGAMIFILYPEGEISAREIEEERIGANFLEDPQSLTAKQYHVYDTALEEPYFAIFIGDLANRCLFQQIVQDSKKAMSADLLLQNFRRLRMLPEEIEEIEEESQKNEQKENLKPEKNETEK